MGGLSVGAHDHVGPALEALGARWGCAAWRCDRDIPSAWPCAARPSSSPSLATPRPPRSASTSSAARSWGCARTGRIGAAPRPRPEGDRVTVFVRCTKEADGLVPLERQGSAQLSSLAEPGSSRGSSPVRASHRRGAPFWRAGSVKLAGLVSPLFWPPPAAMPGRSRTVRSRAPVLRGPPARPRRCRWRGPSDDRARAPPRGKGAGAGDTKGVRASSGPAQADGLPEDQSRPSAEENARSGESARAHVPRIASLSSVNPGLAGIGLTAGPGAANGKPRRDVAQAGDDEGDDVVQRDLRPIGAREPATKITSPSLISVSTVPTTSAITRQRRTAGHECMCAETAPTQTRRPMRAGSFKGLPSPSSRPRRVGRPVWSRGESGRHRTGPSDTSQIPPRARRESALAGRGDTFSCRRWTSRSG